jgi:hypothetical protein
MALYNTYSQYIKPRVNQIIKNVAHIVTYAGPLGYTAPTVASGSKPQQHDDEARTSSTQQPHTVMLGDQLAAPVESAALLFDANNCSGINDTNCDDASAADASMASFEPFFHSPPRHHQDSHSLFSVGMLPSNTNTVKSVGFDDAVVPEASNTWGPAHVLHPMPEVSIIDSRASTKRKRETAVAIQQSTCTKMVSSATTSTTKTVQSFSNTTTEAKIVTVQQQGTQLQKSTSQGSSTQQMTVPATRSTSSFSKDFVFHLIPAVVANTMRGIEQPNPRATIEALLTELSGVRQPTVRTLRRWKFRPEDIFEPVVAFRPETKQAAPQFATITHVYSYFTRDLLDALMPMYPEQLLKQNCLYLRLRFGNSSGQQGEQVMCVAHKALNKPYKNPGAKAEALMCKEIERFYKGFTYRFQSKPHSAVQWALDMPNGTLALRARRYKNAPATLRSFVHLDINDTSEVAIMLHMSEDVSVSIDLLDSKFAVIDVDMDQFMVLQSTSATITQPNATTTDPVSASASASASASSSSSSLAASPATSSISSSASSSGACMSVLNLPSSSLSTSSDSAVADCHIEDATTGSFDVQQLDLSDLHLQTPQSPVAKRTRYDDHASAASDSAAFGRPVDLFGFQLDCGVSSCGSSGSVSPLGAFDDLFAWNQTE